MHLFAVGGKTLKTATWAARQYLARMFVFGFANNYLNSVSLWRKKGFVKVPVLHSVHTISNLENILQKKPTNQPTRTIKFNADIYKVKPKQL